MYVCTYVISRNFTDYVDIEKLKDDNVVGAFTYLFSKLEDLFATVNITKLRSVCVLRGAPLPKEFKEQMKAAKELSDILDVLDNPLYCNWLNVRLLKRIAKNIDNKRAVELIEIYEDSVHSRKVADVKKYFSICFNKNVVSLIEVKINKSHEDLTVKEILQCCKELENTMDIYYGGVSVIDSNPGCLLITIVIPLHCSLHAFNMATKNILKLRQYHIQYLEIESFPKVFAFNHPVSETSLASLSSGTLKCKVYLECLDVYLFTMHKYVHIYIVIYVVCRVYLYIQIRTYVYIHIMFALVLILIYTVGIKKSLRSVIVIRP